MITNIHRNIMGTASFDGQFPGMRKPQDFIVYPMPEEKREIKVQSKTRIGTIKLDTGEVLLTPPKASGSYFRHLLNAKTVCTLNAEQLLMLKAGIAATAGKLAGSSVVKCDNGAAGSVLAVGS